MNTESVSNPVRAHQHDEGKQMAQHRNLGNLTTVTDCSTGMYRMGEFSGGWNGDLKEYLKSYGEGGYRELCVGLNYLGEQLLSSYREVNQDRTQSGAEDVAESILKRSTKN